MLGRVTVAALCALLCATRAAAMSVDDLPPDAVYTLKAVRVEGNRARYFESRVSHDLEVEGENVTIVLDVEEGPAAKLADVALVPADFALEAAEEKALRRLMMLETGDVFTQEAYDESRARLERHYLEQGFAYVEVAKAAEVDTAEDTVRVTYTVTRRDPAVFGATTVSGTKTVADRLATREIVYQPGDAYDPKKIEETQASIFGLRLFRSVTVKPANLDARTGVVDMAIVVAEGPPREIRVGVGYGLEDEFRGQIRWQHNNFFGGGRQLGFQLKGSSIEQAAQAEFRQPHFLAPQQTLIVPLTQIREDEVGYTAQRTRLAPRLERRITPRLRGSVGYNIEYDDVTDIPRATIPKLEEVQENGFLSSVVGTLERNTTLDLLDPHDGSVINLTAEVAGGPLQGDFGFYRALLELKRYVPVFGTRVIAGRLRVGGSDAFDQSRDVPIFRRFFAGGINSTRGYGRHLLGPLNDSSDHDPVGGRTLLEANLEFRTPLYKQLGGVVFVDMGEVRRKPWSFTSGDLQFGFGAGIRYNTLVGPIRLDLGFPLEAPPGEPSWQVHFSIGQAF
jgi:outer membrane protein assembly complex protein YaeT